MADSQVRTESANCASAGHIITVARSRKRVVIPGIPWIIRQISNNEILKGMLLSGIELEDMQG